MAKFSKPTDPVGVPTPLQTVSRGSQAPDTLTHEAGAGWTRDAKSELFLLAVHNFVSEQTFYEDGQLRDKRFGELIAAVAADEGGGDWLARLIPYLRSTLHMRSASVVLAVETARSLDPAAPGSRAARAALVDAACARADEPAEALGYYMATNARPRVLPNWLRLGLARAAVRLYDEFAVLQYDGRDRGVRMADVLELCHTPAQTGWKADLFRHILDRRHGRGGEGPETLAMLEANRLLRLIDPETRRALVASPEFPATLKAAGMKWSDLDGWLQGPMDAAAWQAVIPSMGYMALLRNLRNFDGAGVPDEVAMQVAARLADPAQVATSRQLPFRFLSAYKAVSNDRWRWPLERAVQASLANVPALAGRTLVLVDCSGSMWSPVGGGRSALQRYEAAALFGCALALRAESADVIAYGSDWRRIMLPTGASLLGQIGQFPGMGRTNTFPTLAQTYQGHDRVVILTDEQAFPISSPSLYPSYLGPQYADPVAGIRCPIYTFNLAGYQAAHLPSAGNRYSFGGLTDNAFVAIEQIERREVVGWPF